jgi:hypothetical protein
MAVTVKVRGPNKTVASLSPAQAEAAKDIIVSMMNQELTPKTAEALILETCAGLGIPLVFEAARSNKEKKTK